MTRLSGRAARSSIAEPLLGVGLAALIGAGWVALTAATGKTYHLAPVAIALMPGLIPRLSAEAVAVRPLVAAGAGIAAVAVAWAAIVLVGVAPEATLVDDQPGGVAAEVAVGAIAGAAIGAQLVRAGR